MLKHEWWNLPDEQLKEDIQLFQKDVDVDMREEYQKLMNVKKLGGGGGVTRS